MSTETFDISEVEREQLVPERPDEREDDNLKGCEDGQQQSMPLGVELTGYRLLTTSIILGLGIPKAVYSYNGQSLISTTLDWVAGILLALILYWLGVIEANRPGLSPLFFQVELAPPILKFIRRSEVLPLLLTSTP
ncbi:hypothetical protein BC827DRAFT_49382 [Russula dissimulans]|nr:hypothetical protein BC827DRAFT_49382 [Russula dissimulans]